MRGGFTGMTYMTVADLFRGAFLETLWLALPLLGVGFLAGALVSLVQILTSIQDSGFSALPRLGAFLAALLLALPWMIVHWIGYTAGLLSDLGRYAR